MQKQPSEVLTCNFIKKKLQHRCFPVKFAKILRTSILKNICEELLLIMLLCLVCFEQNPFLHFDYRLFSDLINTPSNNSPVFLTGNFLQTIKTWFMFYLTFKLAVKSYCQTYRQQCQNFQILTPAFRISKKY